MPGVSTADSSVGRDGEDGVHGAHIGALHHGLPGNPPRGDPRQPGRDPGGEPGGGACVQRRTSSQGTVPRSQTNPGPGSMLESEFWDFPRWVLLTLGGYEPISSIRGLFQNVRVRGLGGREGGR